MTRLGRLSSMSPRWCLVCMFGAIALAGSGCGLSPAASSAAHTGARMTESRVLVRTIAGAPLPPGHVTAVNRQSAVAQALRLLGIAVIPPGSYPVAHLTGRSLAGPADIPACGQVEEATRLWATQEAPALVTAFLLGHIPAGTRNSVQGGSTYAGRPTSSVIVDDVSRRSRGGKLVDTGAELVFTFARIGSRTTGLRVDAITVPKGANCLGGGGGAQLS